MATEIEGGYYSMISIAPLGHWTSQALQTKQASLSLTVDFSSTISKTSTGQTSTHVAHPSHFSLLTLTLTMNFHTS